MPIDPHTFDTEGWQRGTVVWRQLWPDSEGLVSLRLSERVTPHCAGQYIKLACADAAGAWGVRYLSVASAPEEAPELLVAPTTGDREPGDPSSLAVGDEVAFSCAGAGALVVPPGGGGTLWLIAAGTGLAPLLAVCRAGNTGFERVVLVHSVRHAGQLAWREELQQRANQGEVTYIPLVTQRRSGAPDPRVTTLFADGQLASRAGVAIDPERDAAMLCGSGAMTKETRAALTAIGFNNERVVTEF